MGNAHSVNISELSRKGMGDVGWEYAASEDQLKIDTTEYSQINYDYVKKAEFTVPDDVLSSGFRMKADIKTDNGEYAARAKIYKNGVELALLGTTFSTSYVAVTCDITGVVAGDTVEVWISSNETGVTAYIDNYSISGVSTRKYLKKEPTWA